MTIYECELFLRIHIVTSTFIVEIVCILLDYKGKNLYIGGF